ncbi:MAG TPA: hypothetical protein DGT23_21320, partial [Micromonosporaceae bacterium]|nr:hypothetical protein [Micromonosporaceae bacterium]
AGLGFGGVEVDTVLSGQPGTPGGALAGQVNLRAKGDTDITGIQLLLVANGALGEVELARYPVSGHLNLASGMSRAVPFTITLPGHTPFTVLYGQQLPSIQVGLRTEVAVSSGSGKTDFDPARIDALPAHQHIVDALGTIGSRFARNELGPGTASGLNVPVAQAITFYAPIPEGQQPGPHIPQIVFLFAGDGQHLTVVAELAGRPGSGDRHELTAADIERLNAEENGWVGEVDRWVTNILDKLSQPAPSAPGVFMQPGQPQASYGAPVQKGYSYSGHQSYKTSGYRGRPSMGGAIAAGVGGAALGFLGGMVIGDMIGDAFAPDATDAAAGMEDPGMADAGGYEDAGGFDDFGGGFSEF